MWRSGDEDVLQSQRSGVQIRVSAKIITNCGVRSRVRVRDRIRVRPGGERVILFEEHPSPQKSGKSLRPKINCNIYM